MEVLVILVPAALMGHVSAQMDIQELVVKLVSNNLISKKNFTGVLHQGPCVRPIASNVQVTFVI